MDNTSKLFHQEQDHLIWSGLQTFSAFPDWLTAARSSSRICTLLSILVPEIMSGQYRVESCKVGHVRYSNDRWAALYDLVVIPTGKSKPEKIKLQGVLDPPGVRNASQPVVEGKLGEQDWRVFLPELNLELKTLQPETALAALQMLTDPVESCQFLVDHIRAQTPAYRDLQVKNCIPKVVRYKPGSRCTVVYRLEYEKGLLSTQLGPELVVAKTNSEQEGKNAYDSMRAIWDSPLGASQVVRIAEPLAYDPETRVMIQGPIREEKTLKELLESALDAGPGEVMNELKQFLRKTAQGLAELHRCGVGLGRVYDWMDHVAEIEDQVKELGSVLSSLVPAAQPLMDRLNWLAQAAPPDPLTACHGSFRPPQVLIYQDQIGFIDFDAFCQSEPANDLAHFLATMLSIMPSDENDEGKTIQVTDSERLERFDLLMTLHNQFLEAYEEFNQVSRQRLLLWETTYLFMFVLHGWTKIKIREIDDLMFVLEHFAVANGILSMP